SVFFGLESYRSFFNAFAEDVGILVQLDKVNTPVPIILIELIPHFLEVSPILVAFV
ncbi:MAG: hypothetical protein UU39_C0038G0001, partial [Candidatus Woesebacteria bacterium GW2011_GWD1_41_12]